MLYITSLVLICRNVECTVHCAYGMGIKSLPPSCIYTFYDELHFSKAYSNDDYTTGIICGKMQEEKHAFHRLKHF